MYRKYFKRFLDILASFLAILIFAPIFLILMLLVRIFLGSPIFFKQQRPGIYGKPFLIYKFRTMKDFKDVNGALLPDAKRLTKFGKFLRSTSLDELPELFNVLKGDMSVVGPRPLLMQYLSRYSKEQMRRHEVRPGITGWVQVNGRNAINWEEKFKLDVWYVDHITFFQDLKIFLLTFLKVFKSEGIRQEGQATMEEFLGSEADD